MTAMVLGNMVGGGSMLGAAAPTAAAPGHALPGTEQRFFAALEKASTGNAVPAPTPSPPAGTAVAQSGPAAEAGEDAQERARRALNLDASSPVQKKGANGDLILDGLQKLRGTFDVHEGRLSGMMSKSSTDMTTMLAMQVEVMNLTVLVDVTSKLTGQSAQAFESLLKGQ